MEIHTAADSTFYHSVPTNQNSSILGTLLLFTLMHLICIKFSNMLIEKSSVDCYSNTHILKGPDCTCFAD